MAARVRIQRARELLETSALTVDQVAAATGFATAAALRARFGSELHTTPTAYRRTFSPDGRGV